VEGFLVNGRNKSGEVYQYLFVAGGITEAKWRLDSWMNRICCNPSMPLPWTRPQR